MIHPRDITRAVIVLCVIVASVGCAAKPDRVIAADAPDPGLVPIAASFERAVDRLKNADDATWHDGWGGNVLVNAFGGEHMGLCHEWRDAVYRSVVHDVRAVGWSCMGIAINRGTGHEHHAVLVASPDLHPSDLLPDPPERGAYVLDAWSRGRPDIYRLADWITLPAFHKVPPELIDVHAELRTRDRATNKRLDNRTK